MVLDKRRRRAGAANQLRIIGGRWRSRRLYFPAVDGLRPTPDRVRETLFNWLAPVIAGARCLDLFAGSGALGIEALSRGAAEAVFIERHPLIVCQLQENLALLGAANARVIRTDALNWLAAPAQRFDIVFLDPPFGQGLLATSCRRLVQNNWLAARAYIYLETERRLQSLELPETWDIAREKIAGEVSYRLCTAGDRDFYLKMSQNCLPIKR